MRKRKLKKDLGEEHCSVIRVRLMCSKPVLLDLGEKGKHGDRTRWGLDNIQNRSYRS